MLLALKVFCKFLSLQEILALISSGNNYNLLAAWSANPDRNGRKTL